ncbi:MAG: amidase [Chloroflexi bacterium]|nr:amidase [Chloroflexota bacterium]
MNKSGLVFEPIARLSQLVKSKELSPVALVQAYLQQIHQNNERLSAYITVTEEQALQEAKAAEEAIVRGEYRGPLHGMPIALKDNILTKGVRTTAGSRVLAGHVPGRDATVAKRLKDAGAIVLGKANMSEFARGGVGGYLELPYGTPRNPWDTRRSPGGTSSGSAIAVASGMCAAALGSDTVGSVRGPACLCGVVGLRPTYGRVSIYGVIPRCWQMDTVGPITRSVADSAIMLQILAGRDIRGPSSARRTTPNYLEGMAASVKGMRIGLPKELWDFEEIDPEVKDACKKAAKVLEGLGAMLEEVSIPSAPSFGAVFVAIADAEVAAYHEKWLRADLSKYTQGARIRLETGMSIPSTMYLKAQRARVIIKKDVARALRQVHVLLSPTMPQPASVIQEAQSPNWARSFNPRLDHSRRRFSALASLTGVPAISVPCGFTRSHLPPHGRSQLLQGAGLPIGLQIMGRPFEEATVLAAASAYESATTWHAARPWLL